MKQYNKESVKEVFFPKVNKLANNYLINNGFKHLKSTNEYKRTVSEFRQTISISGYSVKIENIDGQPSICFKVVSVIELPNYIKWLKKSYLDKMSYRRVIENKDFYLSINEMELNSINQYTVSNSQNFKNLVSSKISSNFNVEYHDFEINTNAVLSAFIEKLNKCSNGQFLYSSRLNDHNIVDLLLPIYFDLKKESHLILENKISTWKQSIKQEGQKNPIAIQNLNKLIQLTNEHYKLSINQVTVTNNR